MKTPVIPRILLPVLLAALLAAGGALAQDDGEARLAEAREALNRARYREAATLYERARAETREQRLVAETLYWEAFARYRMHGTAQLKKALALLERQHELQEVAANLRAESEALAVRIAGELAERGEESAAREVYARSEREQQREATRVAALHALMQMDPDRARPMLEKIVRGETKASLEMRQNAVFMLCNEDDQGMKVVLEALPGVKDPALVQAMVMCLAQSETPPALDALVEIMRSTEDVEVAQAVLMALGHHGDPRAFDVLAEIADDPARPPELRAHALFGLGQIGDARAAGVAAGILRAPDQDREVLEAALMALAQSDGAGAGEAAGEVLLALSRDPDVDDELRGQALFWAASGGHVEAATLRDIYAAADSPGLKRQVCHVLTQLPDREAAFEVLIGIVREEDDPEIRRDAVFWMGQFDDPRAAEFLLEIIGEE